REGDGVVAGGRRNGERHDCDSLLLSAPVLRGACAPGRLKVCLVNPPHTWPFVSACQWHTGRARWPASSNWISCSAIASIGDVDVVDDGEDRFGHRALSSFPSGPRAGGRFSPVRPRERPGAFGSCGPRSASRGFAAAASMPRWPENDPHAPFLVLAPSI